MNTKSFIPEDKAESTENLMIAVEGIQELLTRDDRDFSDGGGGRSDNNDCG
ncbi:MAG: hypothetical protein J0H12_03690 [Candidatus Paracaedimonas acanthamoebae]|uniref:Uncharacterized protein n=1 Tax=Candidatus Paracaedimonas acanthamoebae TaxID=244581 RepID=A0A8J7PXX0_9PROT|nr:hypothetical protein [Candidatus Paracaedimonas acanthamoebae]